MLENLTDEAVMAHYGKDKIVAEITYKDGRPPVEMRMSNIKVSEKLEKFMEDVRFVVGRFYPPGFFYF